MIKNKDYTKEVKVIFEFAFRKEWMDDDDWKQFETIVFKEQNINYQLMSDQINEGVKNGYSLEEQENLLKRIFELQKVNEEQQNRAFYLDHDVVNEMTIESVKK